MKSFLDQSIVCQSHLPSTSGNLYLPDGSLYQGVSHSTDRKPERINVPGTLSLDPGPQFRCRLIETIRDPQDPQRIVFLDWRDGESAIQPEIKYRGRIYAPRQSAALISNLTLPTGIRPFGSLCMLRSDLRAVIASIMKVSDDEMLFIESYILASWFPDLFHSVPYLWLVGPPGSGKTTLLRLLSCLCRRAILVGDIRSSALYQLVDALDTTLLVDELELGAKSDKDIRCLLRSGSTRGTGPVRNGRIFSTYGFKVIASRQLPNDAALASRALVVSMLPSAKDLKPLSEEEMRRIATEFQPRLLMFRLTHYSAVRDFQMQFPDLEDMTPRARQFARVLAASLEDDPQAQADLVFLLREQDREMQMERTLEPEWLVAETMFAISHESFAHGPHCYIFVGEIGDQVNERIESRGEDLWLSARRVGAVLKTLGFQTKELGNAGRGLNVTKGFRTKAHKVAQDLGINRSHITPSWALLQGNGGMSCALCEEFGLTAGLQYVNPDPRKPRRRLRAPRESFFDMPDLERREIVSVDEV